MSTDTDGRPRFDPGDVQLVQLGWLRPARDGGHYVTCLSCVPRWMGEELGWCPLFTVNVGAYRQPCGLCGAELTEGRWGVVLFDGQPPHEGALSEEPPSRRGMRAWLREHIDQARRAEEPYRNSPLLKVERSMTPAEDAVYWAAFFSGAAEAYGRVMRQLGLSDVDRALGLRS